MASLSEPTYQGDVIHSEVDRNLSRKNVTVVAVAALKRGTVLAIKTADSKFYPAVDGASDGTQNAVAVLLDDLPITAGAVVPVLRRLAVVNPSFLVWDASYTTQAKKDAAIANLESASTIVTLQAV
jgi:hypothetical protein